MYIGTEERLADLRRRTIWDNERVYELCRLWVAGYQSCDIADTIGVARKKMPYMARVLKLPRRPTNGKVLGDTPFPPLATREEFDGWWRGFGARDTPDWVFRAKRVIERHRQERARIVVMIQPLRRCVGRVKCQAYQQ